jgi:uncharacterized protein YbjQ (UPF0145 family)
MTLAPAHHGFGSSRRRLIWRPAAHPRAVGRSETAPAKVPAAGILPRMIVSTTPSNEGHKIQHYHGVVTGEAILGANIFRDFFASIRDIVGGRSAAYEKELRRARELALGELEQAAAALGANAVVGVDIDYETVGGQNSMLMVSVSGTAVTIG